MNEENITYEGEVILIDKELRWTSFDVVNKIRSSLSRFHAVKKIKVGHAGTLDPLATGLVIICTGKQTKNIYLYQEAEKEYIASFKLGETTPSFDLESEVDKQYPFEHISKENVLTVIQSFIGKQEQVPPIFSAKYHNGKRAYEYARQGKDITLKANTIEFFEIELLLFNPPELQLRILCSKGTYIRSFARDLGIALNSGAYLSALRRTKIGQYKIEDALTVENFEKTLIKL
jgi:tRNA pseudouridine55 synthase